MNDSDKDIIEMHASEDNKGELHYVSMKSVRHPIGASGWLLKILGLALGIAIFLLLIFFFVYVIIPLVLIVILYSLIRNIFEPHR